MDRPRIVLAAAVVVMAATSCGAEQDATLEAVSVEPASTTMQFDVDPIGVPAEGDDSPTAVDLTNAGSDDPSPQLEALAASIEDARQRWATADIATYHYRGEISYDAEVEPERFCGLGRPFTAQIIDGAVVEATGLDGCRIELDDPGRPPLAIEEWFDFLDGMISGKPGAFVGAGAGTELTVFFTESGMPSTVRWQGETSWTEFWIPSAATGVADTSEADDLLAELAMAQARWESAGITDYRFRVLLECFCNPETVGPFEVTVRDGEVIDATMNGQPADEQLAPAELFTVPGLFAEVAGSTEFDEIDAVYDQSLGYPTVIDADPLENTTDDESRIVVSDFEVLGN